MALMRWDPFAELNTLHDQLNSLFNEGFSSRSGATQLAPVTDVYNEGDKQMTVEVHLPNFNDNEVHVSVHDHALEITAEHQEKTEDKQKRQYLVRESSSSFYRRIALPKQADEDGVKAQFDKGVLKVTVPYKELPQPKRVAIEPNSTNKGSEKKK
jgi:HSP20 family protein